TNIPSIQVLRVAEKICNCSSDLYTLTNSYGLSYPMQYGSVIYTLSLNNQLFQTVIPNTASYSIQEGINATMGEAFNLQDNVSHYEGSDNNGTLYLQNLTNECLKINLTAGLVLQNDSAFGVNAPVYSTIKLIDNLELCAFEPRT
ncbi:TPA: hypothetical protein NM870_003357, partial [Acinetobacter baumannii]|nr:hypothetical protein [Acinetobacter baumannii]